MSFLISNETCTEKYINNIVNPITEDLDNHIKNVITDPIRPHGLGTSAGRNVGSGENDVASGSHTHSQEVPFYFSNRMWLGGTSIATKDWMIVEFTPAQLMSGTYIVFANAEFFWPGGRTNYNKESDISLTRYEVTYVEEDEIHSVPEILIQTKNNFWLETGDRGPIHDEVQTTNFTAIHTIDYDSSVSLKNFGFRLSSSYSDAYIIGGQLILIKT